MDASPSDISQFDIDHLVGLAISTGIGFLIGLERQYTKEVVDGESQFAGIRTFTLVSILGFLSALISRELGDWVFGVSFAGVFAFVTTSYFRFSKPGSRGATSEFAILATFVLGGLVFLKMILFALVVMVVMLLLLALKPGIHSFVNKLDRKELFAIILFVVMSALVIPFLPDDNFGPSDLWNLKEIWQMVVLVSGTSLVGYMIAKFMGDRGNLLGGIVGGLVSSTSVALTFSRKSKEAKSSGNSSFYYAIGIIGACTVMFPRILFEVYVVNPALASYLWIPVLLLTAAGMTSAWLIYRMHKGGRKSESLELKNPLDLATAIKFALFYAGIQWLVHYAGEQFGDNGTYIAGAISGITDVDAITLSMAKMARGGGGQEELAVNTILIAAMSNTLVKFLIVVVVGSSQLRKIAAMGFAAIFITAIAYMALHTFFN